MAFHSTGERVTPQNTYDHHPRVMLVVEGFTARHVNPIYLGPGRGFEDHVTERTFAPGDFIRAESWRPEGLHDCRKADKDGYTVDECGMFLFWEYLTHCELCKPDAYSE